LFFNLFIKQTNDVYESTYPINLILFDKPVSIFLTFQYELNIFPLFDNKEGSFLILSDDINSSSSISESLISKWFLKYSGILFNIFLIFFESSTIEFAIFLSRTKLIRLQEILFSLE